MDGSDLRAAERVLSGLRGDVRTVAKAIGPRLRRTGLASTFEWLKVGAEKQGKGILLERLEAELGVRTDQLEKLDTPTLVRLYDRATRLGDALHVLVRTEAR